MNKRTIVMAALLIAVSALALAKGAETRYTARLTGWGKGKAVFKVKAEDAGVQTELQIEGENLPRNTNFIVFVGKENVWHVRTNSFGRFEVRENAKSEKDMGVGAGTPVMVNDTTGNTVLSGKFVKGPVKTN